MNRSLLISLALFLSLTMMTFCSMHFQFSSRIQQRKQIELEYEQELEQEILRKEQDWADTAMAHYEQVRGFRPVRSGGVQDQPTAQTESNLRGSSNADTKDKTKSVKPF
jgi:hypothetical protein